MKQLAAFFILLGIILLLNDPLPLLAAEGAGNEEITESVHAGLPAEAASHNGQGILLFNKGEYGAALLEFNRALAEDPRNITVLINRGAAFAKRGQYPEAIENFQYALGFDKNNVAALKHLAAVYLLTGEVKKAIDVYDKLAGLDPSDFLLYTKRGASYAALGRYDMAIADFSRTIYLNTRYYPAYVQRGVVFTESGKPQWAVSDFDIALRASSKDPFIYLSRSDAYARAGNYKDALADLKKACSLGYREVCDAVKQAKADIEGAGSSFALKYATKTPDEELYTAARTRLDSFVSEKQRSEVQKFVDDDLRPLPMGEWRPLMTDMNKTFWSVQPSGASSVQQGVVTVRVRFRPEEGSPLYLQMQDILKTAGKSHERYQFSEDTFEINCMSGKIRAISNREFDLDGVNINSENNASSWFDIAPGSPADTMRQSFCR